MSTSQVKPKATAGGISVYCAFDEIVPIERCVPNPRNPNQHPDKQIELLAKIIRAQGWRAPITISTRSGYIVRGHGRLLAAQKLGVDEVPVDYQDYENEASEWADLIADNRIAELAEMDNTALKDLLEELDTGAFDMELTGFTEDALEELMTQFHVEPEVIQDEVPEPPEKPVTRPGDVWLLGEHRVMCGDSTVTADVERLMNGRKADMIFTDPPYNIASESRNYAKDAPTLQKTYKALAEAVWDKDFKIEPALNTMLTAMANDCVVYICTSHFLIQRIWDWAGKWSKFYSYCVWCKPNPAPSLSKRHWTWATELIVYAVRGKHVCNFPKEGHALNWWEINSPTHTTDHPTEKPVALPAKAIGFSSNPGALVLDLFLGTGSTLVAAEQLGRICYGMEIDPRYVDVAIRRWEMLTGRKAVRDDGTPFQADP